MEKARTSIRSLMEDFVSLTGEGVAGKVYDQVYFVGNSKLFDSIPQDISVKINELQDQEKTVMIVGADISCGSTGLSGSVRSHMMQELIKKVKGVASFRGIHSPAGVCLPGTSRK